MKRRVADLAAAPDLVDGGQRASALERMRTFAVRPCLALSLHTANEARRRELVAARAQGPAAADIVAAADA
jgi:adenine C2-methylase RlmN of 23S rRNA A2503 and tRNA A37